MDLLRHLRFFTEVANTRHFGDAARELGMTQPPLSQGIRRLEERLGVRLFDRDARGVRLTAAGQRLLPSAREMLVRAGEFDALARNLAIPREVRLGIAGDLDDLIPQVVRALASEIEAIRPVVRGSVEIVDLLREGMLDIAVVRHPGIIDGLSAGPVLVIPTRFETSPGREATITADLPVAVPPRHHQPPAHDQLIDALRRAGHSGSVVEADSSDQRRALAATGGAMRLVPVGGEAFPGEEGPPLRVRIVIPSGTGRREELDHHALGTLLERALTL